MNPSEAEVRQQPSVSELLKLTKAKLAHQLWGEIRTNIELNAQLRAVRQSAQPQPGDLQAEPPYPGETTVIFPMRDPNSNMAAHSKSSRCDKDYPHRTDECGEWREAGQPQRSEAPTYFHELCGTEFIYECEERGDRILAGCPPNFCPYCGKKWRSDAMREGKVQGVVS